MMNKLYILIVLFGIIGVKAQILDEYPQNQTFYEGGMTNFYKEAHEFLINSKAKECAEGEIFQPRIIITKDLTIKMVQDGDDENIKKNKCAYELSLSLLKNLKNWKAAEVKGDKYGAVTEFIVYPKDLMSNYKPGYVAEDFVTEAHYPGGQKDFTKIFNTNFKSLFLNYHINGNVNLEFYISKKGDIVNARIYPAIDNRDFNVDFMRSLGRIKKTWKPAMYSNIPIKQRIAFPVSFYINFIEERIR